MLRVEEVSGKGTGRETREAPARGQVRHTGRCRALRMDFVRPGWVSFEGGVYPIAYGQKEGKKGRNQRSRMGFFVFWFFLQSNLNEFLSAKIGKSVRSRFSLDLLTLQNWLDFQMVTRQRGQWSRIKERCQGWGCGCENHWHLDGI